MPKVKTIKQALPGFNRRKLQCEPGGCWKPKITKTAFKDPKRAPRLRIECGCCESKVDVYYDEGKEVFGLEIGGVNGSLEAWREVLLPLLRIKSYEI